MAERYDTSEATAAERKRILPRLAAGLATGRLIPLIYWDPGCVFADCDDPSVGRDLLAGHRVGQAPALAIALAAMPYPSALEAVVACSRQDDEVLAALHRIGPSAVPHLRAVLTAPGPEGVDAGRVPYRRGLALEGLAALGPTAAGATEAVRSCLDEQELRSKALRALYTIVPARARPLIERVVFAPESDERTAQDLARILVLR